jgi:hypothetical protein
MGIALIPALLRSVSILISEASPWQIIVWLALAVCFAFWQWKFTEALIAAIPYVGKTLSKLIERLRR